MSDPTQKVFLSPQEEAAFAGIASHFEPTETAAGASAEQLNFQAAEAYVAYDGLKAAATLQHQ